MAPRTAQIISDDSAHSHLRFLRMRARSQVSLRGSARRLAASILVARLWRSGNRVCFQTASLLLRDRKKRGWKLRETQGTRMRKGGRGVDDIAAEFWGF